MRRGRSSSRSARRSPLPAPAGAHAARVAVGLDDGVAADAVVPLIEEATGSPVDRSLEPIGAVVVSVDDPAEALEALDGLPESSISRS